MTEWWDGFLAGVLFTLLPSLCALAYLLLTAPTLGDDE